MRVLNELVLSQAVGASVISDVFDTRHIGYFSAQYSITGSSGITTGALKLQASNFPDHSVWSDIPLAVSGAITTNGTGFVSVVDLPYPYVRVVYSQASGNGTLMVAVNGKGF